MEQSEMDLDFDKIYAIPVTCMRIIRNHPEIPLDMKWGLQFFTMYFFFTIQYVATAYNVAIAVENGDFSEACRNGTVSVMFWVVLFQYFVVVIKRDNMQKIMNRMKNDFEKKLSDDEKLIVLKYAKQGNSVCRKWFAVSFSTGALFPMKFILLEFYLYIVGDLRPVMMFPMILPSPLEEHKMEPFLFIFITFLVVYYVFYAICTFTSFVPIGPSFMLHACGQLEIIKKRASKLYVNTSGEDTKAKLIEIVKELQDIYDFVEYINDMFRVIYEITMKGSTIMIPITLYQILESFRRGEFSLEFIGFIISSTVISSLPCYYSDMLMEKGEDVRLAVYSCGWETVYDHGTRTTILLILQRALRPCSIRTLFRTMNLDALTDVFQQAYGIFNLMNAAWG